MTTDSPRRRDFIEAGRTLGSALRAMDVTKKKDLLANARETLKPHAATQPEQDLYSKVSDLIDRYETKTTDEVNEILRSCVQDVNDALMADAIPGGRRKTTTRRRKPKTRSRKTRARKH